MMILFRLRHNAPSLFYPFYRIFVIREAQAHYFLQLFKGEGQRFTPKSVGSCRSFSNSVTKSRIGVSLRVFGFSVLLFDS